MLQNTEGQSGSAGDGNATSPSPATDNAAAAAGGNAPSSSPSPATVNASAGGVSGGGIDAGANAPPAAGPFPGYPRSGGLLSPQLSPLLVAIQEAHLYNDSKTAVDLVLRGSVDETVAAYQQLLSSSGGGSSAGGDAANTTAGAESSGGGVSPEALRQFVNTTMQPAGSDLITCQAGDWTPDPPGFLTNLQQGSSSSSDAAAAAGSAPDGNSSSSSGANTSTSTNTTELLKFGRDLHQLWGLLCRQVSPNVSANPERHSLLPLTESTIVPGDRFRETYYWDSYWVIRGLLVSGMQQSALNLVSNLLSMLEAVGHVPNGARVYYINRSQPPLLSAMVREVYEAQQQTAGTDDSGNSTGSSSSNGTQLLSRALPLLLREHEYWTTGDKAVTVVAADGSQHNLSRYWANWTAPRPESYREDAELAANVTGSSSASSPDGAAAAAAALYRELASGAESGWDYSSRWFGDGKTMATIRTTQIVPADLNAFLYQLETNIAWAAELLGQEDTSKTFNRLAAGRRDSINKLLWDNETGMWRDGILQQQNSSSNAAADAANSTNRSGSNGTGSNTGSGGSGGNTLTQNPGVFASNFVPLWVGVAAGDIVQGSRVVEALQGSGLVQPAGIATTLYNTGQQWDWPNGWPPLQHMLVQGARQYGGPTGQEFACSMARTWLGVNLAVFKQTGHMHEKYDVTKPQGDIGGGGEYAPQVGFGWSNGVALHFLANYC